MRNSKTELVLVYISDLKVSRKVQACAILGEVWNHNKRKSFLQ